MFLIHDTKCIPKTYTSIDCRKCGIFEKIFPFNYAQIFALHAFSREKILIKIFASIHCFRPGSNWGSNKLPNKLFKVRQRDIRQNGQLFYN
jgi:hypothetical protein